MRNKVELDLTKLNKFKKELGKMPSVRIGLRADEDNRPNELEGKTNTEIGLIHEFGGSKMPQRSFLRMPLNEELPKRFKKIKVNPENIKKFFDDLGALGVQIVLEAFATGGFGKWKPSNMKRKRNQQTLVETSHLQRSVAYEVVGDD